jgi:hypothetical protein
MKIVGGIALVIAVLLAVIAMMSVMSAAHMEHQVENFSEFEQWANELSGQSRVNQAKINDTVIVGTSFGIGALLLGGLGVVFIVASFLSGKPSRPTVDVRSSPGIVPAGGRSNSEPLSGEVA